MREVPSTLDAAWIMGDFTGANQPMARVTVQHCNVGLTQLPYNTYASIIFGPGNVPKELPNTKSVKWSRSIDTDIQTATLEFYNTAPQPLGTTFNPDYGLDQPGYYTFNRGATTFSARWGHTTNEWQNLLMPDNILRTFEGYGFDATVIPELDPHLVQTGMWIIDQVVYNANGLITVTCSDLARILRDQIIFVPVVPNNFYPLAFSPVPQTSGFRDGYTYTFYKTADGSYDPNFPPPASWGGPTTAPGSVTAIGGDKSISLTWSLVPAPPTGYTVVGYQPVVDGVGLSDITWGPATASATITGHGLVDGNVYNVQLAAIYQRTKDRVRQASTLSPVQMAYTHAISASIAPNSTAPNEGPSGAANGWVSYSVTAGPLDTVTIVVYTNGTDATTFTDSVNSTGTHYFNTNLGDLSHQSILVYPSLAGQIGTGDMFMGDGTYAFPPSSGTNPSAPQQTTSSKVTGKNGVTVPLKPTPVKTTYKSASNPARYYTVVSGDTLWDLAQYYYGSGAKYTIIYDANEKLIEDTAHAHGYTSSDHGHWIFPGERLIIPGDHGHVPQDAFDSNQSTYWLSGPNARNDQSDSYEWIEASVSKAQVCQVRFSTVGYRYTAYVSVFSHGSWVSLKPTDLIPYKPNGGAGDHKAANIPYYAMATVSSEKTQIITFKSPVPDVTAVRLTFHNLQKMGETGDFRAAVREFVCYADAGATTGTARPGPAGGDSTSVTPYTVYVPPQEVAGAGKNPGKFEDFTDIVKLLCAWGGFYWPQGAQQTLSDGSTVSADFGQGPYGLVNVDPVLGDQDSGRVWGDFEQAGTAGVASQMVSVWDKKSLLDGITYVRDILGMNFYVDEQGGVVWRLPNLFAVGNYVGNLAADAGRSGEIVTIDETQTLLDLTATLDAKNVRERYWVATTDGKVGALAKGYNPNPTGLRRIAGWTDQHFVNNEDAQLMADLLAIRALMTYRIDSVQIPGYPRIQIDDQVRIFERTASEGYLHYVRGIASSLDLESGTYTYDLQVNWLGERPFDLWLFDPAELSEELQTYLTAMTYGIANLYDPLTQTAPPGPTSNSTTSTGTATASVEEVVKLVRVAGDTAVYITNGIWKRHVTNPTEMNDLIKAGVVPSTVQIINAATLSALVTAA